MKSFSQFLQESYLNEEPAGRPARRRTGGPTPEEVKAGIDAKEAEKAAKAAARQPSGAAANPEKYGFKSTKVSSPVRGGDIVPYSAPPKPTAPTPTQQAPAKPAAIVKATPSTPAATPEIKPVNVRDVTPKPKALPAAAPAPSGGGGGAPSGGGGAGGGKPPSGPRLKVPAGAGRALRVAGRIVGPAAAALDVADERSKGSGWLRSLAKGATVAAGGALGGTLGAIGGGGIASGALGLAGAVGGAEAAGKAFDTAAGANAAQRKALATANRRSQAGGALAGIGGKTTFDTKKNTMTTGSGSQRRTVQLGKTSVVTGPGGKQDVGYLAYKGGKAVYKRADTKNLAQTSSNPLERIGRSLFAGAYKKSDADAAAKKLQQARASDVARNKALGVKMKPGG